MTQLISNYGIDINDRIWDPKVAGEFKPTTDRVLVPTHRIPDEWLFARVPEWMDKESPYQRWFLEVLRSNGCFAEFPAHLVVNDLRREFARTIASELNQKANFGGAWMTGYVLMGLRHGIEGDEAILRFYLLWKDQDGDIQIPWEVDNPWYQISTWPMSKWIEDAGAAHLMWCQLKGFEQEEGFKAAKLAQGEPMPTGSA